jgi:hypothetical protein
MRSAHQCLAKAIAFDALSATAQTEVERANYKDMADGWREVAAMASWQDRFTGDLPA